MFKSMKNWIFEYKNGNFYIKYALYMTKGLKIEFYNFRDFFWIIWQIFEVQCHIFSLISDDELNRVGSSRFKN